MLAELENIDDEADQLGIGFVKINDAELASEYNLQQLPALVYYRHQIPIIYESSLLFFRIFCPSILNLTIIQVYLFHGLRLKKNS